MIRTFLKSYRTTHHLTQKEMASILGITREYYTKLERGLAQPSYSLWGRMCVELQLDVPPFLKSRNGKSPSGTSEMCTLCLALQKGDRKQIEKLMRRIVEQ